VLVLNYFSSKWKRVRAWWGTGTWAPSSSSGSSWFLHATSLQLQPNYPRCRGLRPPRRTNAVECRVYQAPPNRRDPSDSHSMRAKATWPHGLMGIDKYIQRPLHRSCNVHVAIVELKIKCPLLSLLYLLLANYSFLCTLKNFWCPR
jgi:hypothetical protein